MYVLTCPICGEYENLSHYGNTFRCKECDNESYLEDMDFEYKEEE